jgi:glucosamine--fructose-6-phosphate aminotransferase (isomerizing)
MSAEMAEQPNRIADFLERRQAVIDEVTPLLRGTIGTVVVARGSSDHAATTGRYLLEMSSNRPVASASPSIHTLYNTDVDFDGYAVVGVSQSGRTPEVTAVLEQAARRGARTIAITNDPRSPLASAAHAVVDLAVGEERAVPATKTVTAELVAFAMLAEAFGLPLDDHDWSNLPRGVAEVLDDPEPMRELALWLADAVRLATVARGPLSGASAETALKLQEAASLLATAFTAADLRHGPIALASTGIRVLVLSHPGPAAEDVLELASDLTDRGADVRVIGPAPGSVATWSADVPESLAPVLAVVRGQQLALHLALVLGLDPDHPQGLTKVTVT